MEGLVPIAIWLSIALVAIGFLVIIVFGLKSLFSGKFRVWSIAAMVLPLVIFGICYVLSLGNPDPVTAAAILTSIVMLVAGAVAILITGMKGFIGF